MVHHEVIWMRGLDSVLCQHFFWEVFEIDRNDGISMSGYGRH
jgi:hypothetical protein